MRNEIIVYESVLNGNQHQVPAVIKAKEVENNEYFLALEWIEGIHPEFENKNHNEIVFTALGKWTAEWSKQIEVLSNIPKTELYDISSLEILLNKHSESLKHMFGNSLVTLLQQIVSFQHIIIQHIEKFPLTLDPGDISLHNVLLDRKDKVNFIDFEYCSIRPMIMVVEHFGEEYTSIPYRQSDIDIALKAYVDAWNEHSNASIRWDDFARSHLCARIYYKVGSFLYWIKEIVGGDDSEEIKEWVKKGQEQLQELVNHFKMKGFLTNRM
ncbi:hypothetical protein [Bacillus niameyensis]|uniref:hypothetical protein n=1 Tax=Bacillus niameyensis TaxID=1522308 RepID=UPI000784DD0C|nr:hypothetical protein [Bacillus niameyensis]